MLSGVDLVLPTGGWQLTKEMDMWTGFLNLGQLELMWFSGCRKKSSHWCNLRGFDGSRGFLAQGLISYGAKSSEGRGRASRRPPRQPFKGFLSEETLIWKVVRQKG